IELTIDGKAVDLELVRTADPQEGKIWLFASETLKQVPAIYRSAEGPWIDEIMPGALVKTSLFGVSIAQWLAYLASLVLPIAVLSIASTIILVVARRSIDDPERRRAFLTWYGRLRLLAFIVLTLFFH